MSYELSCFFEKPLKDFPLGSPILYTLQFRHLQTSIKESCVYISSQIFFKVPHKTLKLQNKIQKKLHFQAIWRPNFQNLSIWCPPWGHPKQPLNYVRSKETESLGKNGCRQKYLDKSLLLHVHARGNAYSCYWGVYAWLVNFQVHRSYKLPAVYS